MNYDSNNKESLDKMSKDLINQAVQHNEDFRDTLDEDEKEVYDTLTRLSNMLCLRGVPHMFFTEIKELSSEEKQEEKSEFNFNHWLWFRRIKGTHNDSIEESTKDPTGSFKQMFTFFNELLINILTLATPFLLLGLGVYKITFWKKDDKGQDVKAFEHNLT